MDDMVLDVNMKQKSKKKLTKEIYKQKQLRSPGSDGTYL